jgi:ethanolamine permease
VLRKNEPGLERPFHVPLYPLTPLIALVIAVVSIVAMTYYNLLLAGIYFGILALSFVAYKLLRNY